MSTIKEFYDEWNNMCNKMRYESIKYLKETLAQQEDNEVVFGDTVLVTTMTIPPRYDDITKVMLIDGEIILATIDFKEMNILDFGVEDIATIALAVFEEVGKNN